jgi:tetratricopeptide (TPR) repeat protein
MSLNNLGKFEEAIKSFDKAIELDPNFAAVYNHKGWTLTKMGKFHEAIAFYDKAIALDPNLIDAVNFRDLSLRNIEMELELELV